MSGNSIETLRTGDLSNLRFASDVDLSQNAIKYFESASLYLDPYWDLVRQPLTLNLHGNGADASFAVDAFGEMDRAFIAQLDMENTLQTTLPREPFYEMLLTSFERDDDFLTGVELVVYTNSSTPLECCSIDWLFVEGRKWGVKYQAQVPGVSCLFTKDPVGNINMDQIPAGGTLWAESGGPTCDDFSKMCVEGGLEQKEAWKTDCLNAIYYSSGTGGESGGDGQEGSSGGNMAHFGNSIILNIIIVVVAEFVIF